MLSPGRRLYSRVDPGLKRVASLALGFTECCGVSPYHNHKELDEDWQSDGIIIITGEY